VREHYSVARMADRALEVYGGRAHDKAESGRNAVGISAA
jgi:hypothetical protein